MVAKILLNSKFGWKLSRCAYKFFRWLSDNLFFLTLWTNCWDKIDFSFCNLFCSYSRKARSHPVHCKLQLKLSNRFQFQIWLALIQLQTTELRKQSQLCARFFFSQFFLVLIFFLFFISPLSRVVHDFSFRSACVFRLVRTILLPYHFYHDLWLLNYL